LLKKIKAIYFDIVGAGDAGGGVSRSPALHLLGDLLSTGAKDVEVCGGHSKLLLVCFN